MAENENDTIKAVDVPEREVENAANEDSMANKAKPAADAQGDAVTDEPATTGETTTIAETSNDMVEGSGVLGKDDQAATGPDNTTAEQKTVDVEELKEDPNERTGSKRRYSGNDRYDRNDRNKQRRGGGYGKNSRSKARFEDQPESSDANEIRAQVEFYFSDSNLPIDQYLFGLTGGHENKPVSLKIIHDFKRMRHFQPYQAVRDAVKASEFLILDDKDEISRKIPLSDKYTDDVEANKKLLARGDMSRSIYAKGFGEENKTTHLDIEAFFAPYGPVNAVRLRRHDDGEFKGSVFVEFADEDTMKQFLELDPKPQWEGKDLEIMSKQEYVDVKHKGIIDGVVKPRGQRGPRENRGRFEGRDRHDKDKRHAGDYDGDKDDWKSRREHDRRDDRRGGRGRGGGGRGRGRGGRGGRGGRDNRRRSPDFRDRDRKHGNDHGDRDEQGDKKINGGAESDVQNGGGSKKRARDDDGEEAGSEAKKAKDEVTA